MCYRVPRSRSAQTHKFVAARLIAPMEPECGFVSFVPIDFSVPGGEQEQTQKGPCSEKRAGLRPPAGKGTESLCTPHLLPPDKSKAGAASNELGDAPPAGPRSYGKFSFMQRVRLAIRAQCVYTETRTQNPWEEVEQQMTSREIVRCVVRHQEPPRIAWDFLDPAYRDIQGASPIRLINEAAEPFLEFGDYEHLKKKANFHGEVRMDAYGNIYGRLNGKTKGECVLGALEEGWESLDRFEFPTVDMAHVEQVKGWNLKDSDKYTLTYLPPGVFSTLRDLRKMDNALMDTAAEPEMVEAYMEKFTPFVVNMVHLAAD